MSKKIVKIRGTGQQNVEEELIAWMKATEKNSQLRKILKRLQCHRVSGDEVIAILKHEEHRQLVERQQQEAMQAVIGFLNQLTGRPAERLCPR